MNSSHGFIEGKSTFGSLTAPSEEMLVDKGTAVGVVYFGFKNIFGHGLPQNACSQIRKIEKAGLESRWKIR